MQYARVKDHPYLLKDLYSKAIINIDPTAPRRHHALATNLNKEVERDQKINQLMSDVSDLKGLLHDLLSKLSG